MRLCMCHSRRVYACSHVLGLMSETRLKIYICLLFTYSVWSLRLRMKVRAYEIDPQCYEVKLNVKLQFCDGFNFAMYLATLPTLLWIELWIWPIHQLVCY